MELVNTTIQIKGFNLKWVGIRGRVPCYENLLYRKERDETRFRIEERGVKESEKRRNVRFE